MAETDTNLREQAILNRVYEDESKSLKTISPDASFVFGYTGSNITSIQKTLNGVTKTKTLTYDGSNNLTNISVWV